MYQDNELILATDLAITDAAVASEEELKFPETNPNKGAGTPLTAVVTVKEAFATSDAATLTIDLQDSADGTTYASILTLPAYAAAALAKGTIIRIPVPDTHRQYLALLFTPLATKAFTAGKVDAVLVANA